MEAEPSTQVNLTLNPNAIMAPLHRILQESFNHVAIGLHAVDQYETDKVPNLPTSFFHFRIGEHDKDLTHEQLAALKDSSRIWMLTSAFGDFIKAIFAALQKAHLFCEVASTSLSSFTSLQQLTSHLDSIRTTGQTYSLPTLIDRVSERLKTPLELREHILSINKVRNCLEHRHGIVQEKDLNDLSDTALVMRWRRSKFFYERDGDEVEVTSGSIVDGPATIKLKFQDSEKSFELGKRIELTVDEFNEVMFTCNIFGQDMVSKLPSVPAAPPSSEA